MHSKGASDSVLIMFDERVVKHEEECVGDFTVQCSFANLKDSFQWAFAGVYGLNIDLERRQGFLVGGSYQAA